MINPNYVHALDARINNQMNKCIKEGMSYKEYSSITEPELLMPEVFYSFFRSGVESHFKPIDQKTLNQLLDDINISFYESGAYYDSNQEDWEQSKIEELEEYHFFCHIGE